MPPRDLTRHALPAVQVLTTGSWPTATQPKCALPMELEQCTRVFHDFYKEKHNGRNLVWHTSMGTADLKASFYGRKKEINVTTYQMCLLLLFNDQPSYTFSELADVRSPHQRGTFFVYLTTF